MSSYLQQVSYFLRLPFHIQWRTFLVQLPRYVPLTVLHITSPKGPHPFVIALPSRKNNGTVPVYVFSPPQPVDLGDGGEAGGAEGEWKVPVILDFHGGGFIMGSPLEQAPYCSMMSRELGAVVISVSYRIGPFHQFPAAIHDAEDVLSAILDTGGLSKAGRVLRTEIQRHYSILRQDERKHGRHGLGEKTTIVLDPTRLSISGFSAGGNIALNMAVSVPPCAALLLPMSPRLTTARSTTTPLPSDPFSPLIPPPCAPTYLDDPCQPWPSLLLSSEAQPRLLPLLLFYPSLDARLLPHERPAKPMPSALKGNDKTPSKPKAPGLFSILGPTYLPKRLRPHPRASPGLADPSDIQKNAAIFLVLPEKDSLAVQSDVWVDKMNLSGWNGPIRFGDGRAGDWNGHEGGLPLTARHENGGLEVWHAPRCRHGWTQFPEIVLGDHEKRERDLGFTRALEFVKESWRKTLPVSEFEDRSQSIPALKIPP
ncbi:alpha/beta-hydrolase [Lindgomyces ingoldianus]|uniref:Alpha/beta-hydrolase n=1 Tax=Lindgomyces ingoldianus TaxID=673940 RepID=A0ACB6RD97_9PLEO|nr:alpha/beta-hydrolase [Lindgomyces ingoldianus]KAF2477318.1 alpha/beta-hydrolase [Lindgomyces ingoldianus]